MAEHIKVCKHKNQRFPEDLILNWFLQIVFALKYIHTHKILHRDLKTSNLFLCSNGVVKIGDFGISRILHGTLESAETIVGTPYYMSPEVCQNKPYSFKSDIWSLGCILYELCTLEHAFKANNLLGLVYKIIEEKQDPIPDCYSSDLQRLLNGLLLKNSSTRLSLDKLLTMPFMQKVLCKFLPSESVTELNVELSVKGFSGKQEVEFIIDEDDGILTPQQKIKRNKEKAARQREEELRRALESQVVNSSMQNSKIKKMEQMKSVFDKGQSSIQSSIYSDKTVESQIINDSRVKSSTGNNKKPVDSSVNSQSRKLEGSYKNYDTETIKSMELSDHYVHKFQPKGKIDDHLLTMNNDYVTYNFTNKSLYNQTLGNISKNKHGQENSQIAESNFFQPTSKYLKNFGKKSAENKDEFASDFEELEEYISEEEIDDEIGDFNNTLQSKTSKVLNIGKKKESLANKIGPKLFAQIYEFLNKHREINTDDRIIKRQIVEKFGKKYETQCFEVDQLIFQERNKR